MLIDDHRHRTIPELVMAWGRGWAVSRHTPQPVALADGYRIDTERPGERKRHVLHTWTPASLRAIADADDAPDHWIKIAGPAAELRAALPPKWTVARDDHLMTAPLSRASATVPDSYRLQLETDGDLAVARVLAENGDVAASARLGRSDDVGVFDRVVTDAAHRRRGLGGAVMTALTDHAVRQGARTGVLVASDEGRALYLTLGWTVLSSFPGAVVGPG